MKMNLMNKDNFELRRDVLLTFQVAFLGMVLPTLRGVIVGWDSNRIYARCYYDGMVGDAEVEIASDVEAEIMASFPEHDVEVTVERCDVPKMLKYSTSEAWTYKRKE